LISAIGGSAIGLRVGACGEIGLDESRKVGAAVALWEKGILKGDEL
jgi:hypothetical protein